MFDTQSEPVYYSQLVKEATDVTEFNVSDKKKYLSPIIDLFNQEIISSDLSKIPNFNQIKTMLKKSFKKYQIKRI